MIDPISLTSEWFDECSNKHNKADRILIEKTIRALVLLEQLKLTGLDFIFKGGTCLFLHLKPPKRFSIDIDILLSPEQKGIEEIFDVIVANEVADGEKIFKHWEPDARNQSHSSIPKAHYKFFYQPKALGQTNESYILLDIVFEENPYPILDEAEIRTDFIITDDSPTTVYTPSIDGLLGDKLTAFAPNSIGIPYGKGKELEIIKQLFDVGILFDNLQDIEIVGKTFHKIASNQIQYRSMSHMEADDVFDDIFQTCLLLSTRGKLGKGSFNELQTGIKRIKNHIWSETFHIEKAIIQASKIVYLIELVLSQAKSFSMYRQAQEIIDLNITDKEVQRLNKLRKGNPEAFFYWYHAIKLRQERLP